MVNGVEQFKGEKWEMFRDRHGDRGRELALHLARARGGMTLTELAKLAGLKSAAAVAMGLRRYATRLRTDARERAQLAKVTQMSMVSG